MMVKDILLQLIYIKFAVKIMLIHCIWMGTNNAVGEVFTSTYLLKNLLSKELRFIDALKTYVNEVEEQAKNVRQYSKTVYSHGKLNKDKREHNPDINPLNAFGLIKRTSLDFIYNLKPILHRKHLLTHHQEIYDHTSTMPSVNEYHETCLNIALLQRTYNLNISDLTEGKLTAKNMLELSQIYQSSYNITCNIINHITTLLIKRGRSFEIANDSGKGLRNTWVEAGEIICNSVKRKKRQRNSNVKSAPTNISHKLETPVKSSVSKTDGVKKYRRNGNNAQNKSSDRNSESHIRSSFERLCHSKSEESTYNGTQLFCSWSALNRSHPYLKLGPFFVEDRSRDPYIATYHEFMLPHEIEYFKQTVSKSMSRSTMATTRTDGKGEGLARTSQQGWLSERLYKFPVTESYKGWDGNGTFQIRSDMFGPTSVPEYPSSGNLRKYLIIQDVVGYSITKRIEILTGLVLDRPYASEDYQVANYGLGGQYAPHLDSIGYHTHKGTASKVDDRYTKYYSLVGDRLATFMVYLSNVDVGGGTVFPLLALRNSVFAGDALFWKNLYTDGRTDYQTIHGGCPVLIGSKWITNKWIKYYDNFDTSPCALEELKRSLF